jgi:heme-degrading monooxygenase HmoA
MSYAYVWEFQVPPAMQPEFERHYGPDGTWVQLFRRSSGYLETLLLKDQSAPGRYVTVDRWRDEASFRAFRSAFSSPYERLDQECGRLTAGEHWLGAFTEVATAGDAPHASQNHASGLD